MARQPWFTRIFRPGRHGKNPSDDGPGQSERVLTEDTPIICAGGCGQIIGYLPEGHKVLTYLHGRGYEYWCPECESADRYRKDRGKYEAADRDPPPLQDPHGQYALQVVQSSALAVIALGIALLAAGNPLGFYIAAAGGAAWLAAR